MKPRPEDHRHKLLICGDELAELKKHAYRMAYHHHQAQANFLAGIPDLQDMLPHA